MKTDLNPVRDLVDSYATWLRSKTDLKEVNGWVEITTPFLDRHNDSLQFYVRSSGSEIELTDDGSTIQDLEMSGCTLSSQKRHDLLTITLNGFGIQLRDKELFTFATADNFARKKHALLQAMLAVNDLFFTAQPFVRSLFLEEVEAWLDSSDVRFTPKIKFTGASGYDHVFDFVIPKSPRQPERLLKSINNPDRAAAQNLAFSWHDIQVTRPRRARAFAILNDTEQKLAKGVLDALRNYDIQPVLWTKREEVREELAA